MPSLTRASLVSIAAAAALLIVAPAQALTLVSSSVNGNAIDASFSTPELVAVDIAFRAPGAVSLVFELGADDLSRGSAGFNSIVDNLSGQGFGLLRIEVDRGTLSAGGFASNDGGVTATAADARSVGLMFQPPMTTQAYLGDALLTGTSADWTIGFDSLSAGDTLTLTVTAAIPEPTTWALTLGGLALVVTAGRRARR